MPATPIVQSPVRVCAIDIGTNSTRYMIAEIDRKTRGIRVLVQGTEVTRVGAGIGRREIFLSSTQKTLDTIKKFVAHAQSAGVSLLSIYGTAALREAQNGAEFCSQIKDLTGFPVTLIDGIKEAQLTELAIVDSLGLADRPFRGLDIGGGSIQIIFHVPGRPTIYRSLPLGAVRLTEKFLKSDPPAEYEISAMKEYVLDLMQIFLNINPLDSGAFTIGVGGTMTTLAAIIQGLAVYDHEKIHGFKIGRGEWEKCWDQLAKISTDHRRNIPGLQTGREDIIVAGLFMLEFLSKSLGFEEILVSDHGLLYGMVIEAGRGLSAQK